MDESIGQGSGYDYFDIELVSPIFGDGPRGLEKYSKSFFDPVRIQSSIPLRTNRSTGLHVHVGFANDGRTCFTLEEIKGVALGILFFEGIFSSTCNDPIHD